jgi:hypothetical protein
MAATRSSSTLRTATASARQPGDDLGLRPLGLLDTARFTGMGGADENDRDFRDGDASSAGDLSDCRPPPSRPPRKRGVEGSTDSIERCTDPVKEPGGATVAPARSL